MGGDNIISVNIPNAVSITIMGAIGALVIGGLRKLLKARAPAATPVQ